MNKKVTGFLALAAILLTALTIWFIERPVIPKQASWGDVLAEAERGGYEIISTEDLAKRIFEHPSEVLLVDTRQEWEYRTGHIKGAVNFPMEPTCWARWTKAVELKKMLGPEKDRPLVFY